MPLQATEEEEDARASFKQQAASANHKGSHTQPLVDCVGCVVLHACCCSHLTMFETYVTLLDLMHLLAGAGGECSTERAALTTCIGE